MAKKISKLEAKVDKILLNMEVLGTNLNNRIDNLDKTLSGRIDDMGQSLNGRIDNQGKSLNGRIDDLAKTMADLNRRTNGRIDDLAETMANLNCGTNGRIDYLITYMQEEFTTINEKLDSKLDKKEFIQWVHKYDGSLKEIREARRNRLLFENQFVDLDDAVGKHDDRIRKLEQATLNK